VPIPSRQSLFSSDVSANVRRLVEAGDRMGAIKAYRIEANTDLATAKAVIESL
jgi:hypothetical protein